MVMILTELDLGSAWSNIYSGSYKQVSEYFQHSNEQKASTREAEQLAIETIAHVLREEYNALIYSGLALGEYEYGTLLVEFEKEENAAAFLLKWS